MKGQRCGGATALHIDHGHALWKQTRLHHRSETHLAPDATLSPLPHAAIAKPSLFDQAGIAQRQTGILHRVGVSPLGQVGKRAIGVFAKGCTTCADDVDVDHG